MHVWYITILGVHMWRHVRLIIKLRHIFKPSNLTTRKEGRGTQWWGIGGKKLDISKMMLAWKKFICEQSRGTFLSLKSVLKIGSMILIVIMQHKNSNLFVFYNLYFLSNDPNQKESDLGAKWKWHFKKDLILFVTFRTFADVFFVTFADKDGSIDMCSLQQNGQSAGRVVVVEE